MKYEISAKIVTSNLKKMLNEYLDIKSQRVMADEAADKWLEAARSSAPSRTGKLRRGIKKRAPKYKKNKNSVTWMFELYFSNRGNPAPSSYGESIERGLGHERPGNPYLIPVNIFKDKKITARQFISSPRTGFTFSKYIKGIGVIGMIKGDKRTRGIRRKNKAILIFREIASYKHKPTNFISKNQDIPYKYMKKALKDMLNG